MHKDDYLKAVESATRRQLANICNCPADDLPPSLTTEQSLKFFLLENPKTLHVWKSTGRHGLVWLKRGRRSEIATESAIQHRLNSVEIPATAA